MTKKKLLIMAGCMIVLAGLLAGGMFLYSTRNLDAGTESKAAAEKIRRWIPGDWILAQEGGIEVNHTVLSFSDDTCTRLENGQEVSERAYSINDLSHMILKDPKADCIIENITDYVAKVVDTQTTASITLIKRDGLESAEETDIEGKWKASVHGSTRTENEEITFEDGTFTLFKDGQQAASAKYALIDSSTIEINELGTAMTVYSLNGTKLFLIVKSERSDFSVYPNL